MSERRCRAARCRTILSRFNEGDRCWAHTPSPDPVGELERAMRRDPGLERRILAPDVTRDEFLAGGPGEGELTARDRMAIRTGEWLGEVEERSA